MNFFDAAADSAFGITLDFMGYEAEWHRTEGPVEYGRVHFKDATSVAKIGDKEYDPRDGYMEYRRGVFEGLKELADNNKAELIKIKMDGVVYEFYTTRDKKLFDGQTISVKLMRK